VSTAPLAKIAAQTAAEICAKFDLPSEASKLLENGMSPSAFIEALLKNKLPVPAIDFLAHGLPTREGVWWGCLCMQHVCGDDLPPPERAAAVAAVQWVLQPTEENRAAAGGPAELAGAATAAGSLAMAVTKTGSPAAPKAVASAVKVAALKGEAAQMPGRQKAFAELGLEVAEGRLL
jgi:hypothetical protein